MTKKITLSALIGGSLLALCFITYPLALCIPTRVGVDLRYDLVVPTLFIGTILCLIGFLAGLIRRPVSAWAKEHPFVTGCGAIYVTGLSAVWWLSGSTLPQIITFLSLFIIPVYCVISPRPFPRRFAESMALLWVVHALHGLQQLAVGWQVVGLTGNRNWLAAIIAASAPWAWRSACRMGRENTLWRFFSGALIGGITLLLMYQAGSRAAWLVLGVYAGVACVTLQTRAWRRILITGLAALICLTAFWLKKDAVIHRLADDVRGPIWLSTLRVIADHPLTGVSPGAYRREFVAYRSDWQMKSSKAAAITIHPHNECLRIAAVGGIPAAAVWALAAVSLLIFKTRGTRHATVHYSAFILVGCGMFDLTLFMPATALPALVFLGLHLRFLCVNNDEAAAAAFSGRLRLARVILTLVLFLFAGQHVWNRTRFGWRTRESGLALERQDFLAARDHMVGAYTLFPHEAMRLYEAVKLSLANLNDPFTAARLGELLMELEPDVAHLNWMLAEAYERLGQPEKARPRFKRESELFPFTVRVQSEALDRFISVKDFNTSQVIRDRLGRARFNHLIHQVGRAETEKIMADFLEAVSQNNRERAVDTANRILAEMPPQAWCDPAGRSLAKTGQYPILTEKGGFIGTETDFWRTMTLPSPFRLEGSEAAATAFAAYVSGRNDVDAMELTELFHLGGYQTAIVRSTDKYWPEMVDIRRENTKALVLLFPESGNTPRLIPDVGIEDVFDADRQPIDGLPTELPDTVLVTVPVHAPDFLTRNQILGDILRRGKADGVPPIGVSPALSLLLYQELLSKSAGEGRFTLIPSIQR
ncbi:MAG: O-antigen ligase family protein [Lentisphaeria bacterium]|nr:O-antigen ligase family protein [Lentisphaeria bacterium]